MVLEGTGFIGWTAIYPGQEGSVSMSSDEIEWLDD